MGERLKDTGIETQIGLETQIRCLLDTWGKQAPSTENFEYVELAVEKLVTAARTGKPVAIISPICANYETLRIHGKRHPTVHKEMILTDKGLRRGYVLLHEEIPYRLRELSNLGIPIEYLIILVDYGMSKQLFSHLNPDSSGRTEEELREYIDQVVGDNVQTIRKLVTHGVASLNWEAENQPQIEVRRLTELVTQLRESLNFNFSDYWQSWNQLLRELYGNNTQNNRWASLIREAIKRDGRYLQEAWGITDPEEIKQRVIEDNFGLTAAFADCLHSFHNIVFAAQPHHPQLHHKGDVIILDTIPGPSNPGHKEFHAYNLYHTDGTRRPPTPILRPFWNLVLLSHHAVEVPYLGKSLEKMRSEAEKFGF